MNQAGSDPESALAESRYRRIRSLLEDEKSRKTTCNAGLDFALC